MKSFTSTHNIGIVVATVVFWLLMISFSGCASSKNIVPAPSTVAVAQSVDKAKESASRAGASVQSAKAALSKLEMTATDEQKHSVSVVKESLTTATRELDLIRVSLSKGSEETLILQSRIDGMAADYGRSLDKERAARAAANRWRKWALYLALLSGGLAVWIFRKPLLRLCGVPIL